MTGFSWSIQETMRIPEGLSWKFIGPTLFALYS